MDLKIVYRDEALVNLQEITAWSWERYPETTERFMTALLNHTDLLAHFPSIGAPVRDKPEIPQLIHSPFRVYYRLDLKRQVIDILHIWHGSRRRPRPL